MLPNGHVLFTADKPDTGGPTKLYEFDPAAPLATSLTDVTPPVAEFQTYSAAANTRLLVLPTGQVLFGYDASTGVPGSERLYIYTPDGGPQNAWKPTITSVSASGDHYTLTGTQLNGRSSGGSYGGNTSQMSNYPIVELKDGAGHVYFARTSNWSSAGVATGSLPVSTDFAVPVSVPGGTYSLYVVANGIASNPVSFATRPRSPARVPTWQ